MKLFGIIPYQKIRELGLAGKIDATDVVLLDYICGWASYGKSLRHPGDARLAWLDFTTYMADNPVAGFKTKKSLSLRIKKLRKLGIIDTARDKHGRLYAAPLINLFGKDAGEAVIQSTTGRGTKYNGPLYKVPHVLEVRDLGVKKITPPKPPPGAFAPLVPDDLKDQPKDEKPTSKPQTFWNGETLAFWEKKLSFPPTGTDEGRVARIEAAVQEHNEKQKATVAMFLQENSPKGTRRSSTTSGRTALTSGSGSADPAPGIFPASPHGRRGNLLTPHNPPCGIGAA